MAEVALGRIVLRVHTPIRGEEMMGEWGNEDGLTLKKVRRWWWRRRWRKRRRRNG